LVPRICHSCAEPTTPYENVLKEFGVDLENCSQDFRRGAGCQACRAKGKAKSGRIGIHEVMHVSPKLSSAISRGAHEDELEALADKAGYVRLVSAGLDKAERGLITLENVLACARVD
jgi:type IV pilus assembly protein PilB